MPKPPNPTYSQKEETQKFPPTVTYLKIIPAIETKMHARIIYNAGSHLKFLFSPEKSIDIKKTPNKITRDPIF